MVPLMLCTYLLENKKYDESSTDEEIQALKDRVTISDGIGYYNEVPVISTFSTEVMSSKLHAAIVEHELKAAILMLENSKAPSFQTRSTIQDRFKPIMEELEVCCFVTGKNKLLNIALQFVMNSAKFAQNKIFIYSTKEEALQKIHEKLS